MDEDDGKGGKGLYDTPWASLPLPGLPIGPNSWLTVTTPSQRRARRLAANLDDTEEILIPAHLRKPEHREPPPPTPTTGQRLKKWLRRVLLRQTS